MGLSMIFFLMCVCACNLCMFMFVYVHIQLGVHVYMYIWRPEVNIRYHCLLRSSLLVLRQAFLLNLRLPKYLDWLTSELQEYACL